MPPRFHMVPFAAAAFCLGLAYIPPSGARVEDDLEESVRAIAKGALAGGDVSGLSIAIDVGGEPFLADGWGWSDPAERTAATDESQYRIGTLTEQFTAAAVLRLADDKRLLLDDPVTKHVAELDFGEDEVTLRHLLTHTSGIPSYEDWLVAEGAKEVVVAEVLAFLKEAPLESEPGSCFAFSDSNTFLLGLIVERITERTLPGHLRLSIFEPLGMSETIYCYEELPLSELAHVSHEVAGELEHHASVPQAFGAEGLCSSAPDLVRWQRAIIEREAASEEGYRSMTTAAALSDGTRTNAGCGFSLTPLDEYDCVSFGGGMAGSRAHVAYYPALDLTIAVLAGGDEAPVRKIERSIARRFFDLPEPGIHDLPLEPAELARYVGSYYLGCSEYLVTAEDGHLRVDPPDGAPYGLLYQGREVFLSALDYDVSLTFELEGERAASFTLDEHGAQSQAKRL